jgi:thiol-disulfide isomerase/thioredoxin
MYPALWRRLACVVGVIGCVVAVASAVKDGHLEGEVLLRRHLASMRTAAGDRTALFLGQSSGGSNNLNVDIVDEFPKSSKTRQMKTHSVASQSGITIAGTKKIIGVTNGDTIELSSKSIAMPSELALSTTAAVTFKPATKGDAAQFPTALPHKGACVVHNLYLPWDTPSHRNSSQVTRLGFYKGDFGNKLFVLAKQINDAVKYGRALHVPNDVLAAKLGNTDFKTLLPCLVSTQGFEGSDKTWPAGSKVFGPFCGYCQKMSNFEPINVTRKVMKQAFYMPMCHHGFVSKENELVIHFRNLRFDSYNFTFFREDFKNHELVSYTLVRPPAAFFDEVIRSHVAKYPKGSTVRIICEPLLHAHPTVRYLVAKHNAVFQRTGASSPEHDFCKVMAAQSIAISPSTFGWWASFLSSAMSTIHFPIMPWKISMPWCDLIPEGDKSYVYHDVPRYLNVLGSTAGNNTNMQKQPRRECLLYEERGTQLLSNKGVHDPGFTWEKAVIKAYGRSFCNLTTCIKG